MEKWVTGELITASKMNQIRDYIDNINATTTRTLQATFLAGSDLPRTYTTIGGVQTENGNNLGSSAYMRTGFRVLTRSVMFNLTDTTYEYMIFLYSSNEVAARLYSLTEGQYIQGPVLIPKISFHKRHTSVSTMTESPEVVVANNYRVSVRRVDGADITAEDQAAAEAATTITELTDKTLTIDGAIADAKAVGEALDSVAAGPMDSPAITLSMFQTVGVIGDSFASGHLDTTSGDNYAQSWVQVLARHYGFDAANYSRGGIKAAEWLTHANGLSKMQADIPRQLYFIALGINDATAGTDLTAFKATLTEIAGDVRAHSPDAVLCFITLARLGTSANPAAYLPYSDAIAEVATAVGGLLIRSEVLPVVDSTFWPRYSGHPTAPEYAALAEAYGRAFEAAALEAQATLDSFNSLEPIMNVRALETETDVPLTWEQGMITTSGTTGDSTLRCRTVGASAPQAYSDLGFTLTIPAGFKAYIYTYIGTPNYNGFAGAYIAAWQTGEVSINLPAGRYIKLNGAKLDDSAVTPEDMTGFTLKRRGYTDTTLSKPDKVADAKAVGDRLDALETQTAVAIGGELAKLKSALSADIAAEKYVLYNGMDNTLEASATADYPYFKRVGNQFILNGSFLSYKNLYFKLSTAGSTNRATAKSTAIGWAKQVPFESGHIYRAELKLLSGEYTISSGSAFDVSIFDSNGEEWVTTVGNHIDFAPGACTANVCVHGTKNVTLTNAQFLFTIQDITDANLETTAKTVDGAINELNTGLNYSNGYLSEKTRNLFDKTQLEGHTGITYNDGEIYGELQNIISIPDLTIDGGYEANTQYTISLSVRIETASGDEHGLFVMVSYTDETSDKINFTKDMTSYRRKTFTTDANKTINRIRFGWSSGKTDIWYIKDIQIEKGAIATDYIPYISARDAIARDEIDTLRQDNTMGLAYSWWVNNRAVDSYGNLYFGYISEDAQCGVGCRFPDGTIIRKDIFASEENDDHNAPSVIILTISGAEYVCVIGSTGHNTDSRINCYVAQEPNSITCDFYDRTHTITAPAGYKYQNSYSQAYFDSNRGKIYNFFRLKQIETATSTFYMIWMCAMSSDYGETWSIYRVFSLGASGTLYYMWSSTVNNNNFMKRIVLQVNTTNTTVKSLRTGIIDCDSLNMYSRSGYDGDNIGKPMTLVEDGELAYDPNVTIANYDDFTEVIPAVSGEYYRYRILDVLPGSRNELHFLYAKSAENVQDHHDITDWILYKYTNTNFRNHPTDGVITEIAHLGLPFFAGSAYCTGACMVNNSNEIIYSKTKGNAKDGAHELHHVELVNNAVVSDRVIKVSSTTIARPARFDLGSVMYLIGKYREGQGTAYLTWHFGIGFIDMADAKPVSDRLDAAEADIDALETQTAAALAATFVADGSANILNDTTLTPGSKVNPTTGTRSSDATACRTGYTSYIGPVMLSVDTTEYKWCVWIYTNKGTNYAVTSLTNNDYSTSPVVIPKLTGTEPCFQIGFINLAGDTVTAEMAAALETKMTFTKLVDKSLTEAGAPADAKAVGDRLSAIESGMIVQDGLNKRDRFRLLTWKKNASPNATGGISSLTVIGDKLFVFKATEDNEDVNDNKAYPIGADGQIDWGSGMTFTSNIGHANTVNWNPLNGCLLTARTPTTHDTNDGKRTIIIFPDVTSETTAFDRRANGVTNIDLDLTITVGGERAFGDYRLNAVWGPNTVLETPTGGFGAAHSTLIYVVSDDSSSNASGKRRLALLQLATGANKAGFSYGTAVTADEGAFNGKYNVLQVWTHEWTAINGLAEGDNDMTYYGGTIYEIPAPVPTAGFPLMLHTFDDFGLTWKTERILIPVRGLSGTATAWERGGIAIYNGHMYVGTKSAGLFTFEF